MHGKIQKLCLLFMAWAPIQLQAQELPLSTQDMEDLLYRNESAFIPESSTADYSEGQLRIELNRASAEELEASGLFTSYQVHMLLDYREKFGPLYSIYELTQIPGFRHNSLKKYESVVSVNTVRIPEGKNAGKHMILVNLERAFAGGQSEYTGSPFRSSLRIRSHPWKKLTMALSYEKDAGELFLYRNRPQFLSGYLSYEGERFIKQVVVGNFQLNQGMGLVNGAGFMHRAGDFRINQLSLSRIKPYASLSEYMYEQGMASKMGTNKFQLLLWASYLRFSLSPRAFTENPEADNWLDYRRTSGLYRSKSELEARDLAYRIHSGMQMVYRHKGLSLGVLHGCEWVGPGKKALAVLNKKPAPSLKQVLSLHGNWYKRKLQLSGELSLSEFRSLAFLIGTQYHFSDYVQGSLLVHHYGTSYRGSLPSAYSSGSHIRNEQGIAFHLHMETGKYIIAKLTGELFRYPSPRYLTNVPSAGYRLDLTLQNPAGKMLQWRTRAVSKTWQNSPADPVSKIRPIQDSRVNRFDAQLIYNHHDRFKWQSRLVLSYYSHKQNLSKGYAALQQVTLATTGYLKVRAQFVIFHVNDWENRIYLYEPGFYYSFSFPAYYGSGQKTSLLLTLKPWSTVSVMAKLSVLINRGNRKWETGIQLRLKL